MTAIEEKFMRKRTRNGSDFADYFQKWELMAHLAIDESGCVIGFCISGSENRGKKVFVYELHVRTDKQRGGVGTSLLDMAERSTRGSSPTLELNVHTDNPDAQSYYKHIGFSDFGEVSGGLAILMRRKR